jgi:hypothetical protein
MSIKSAAILFVACAAAASSASAETAQQDSVSLPQFMSSTGRAELTLGSQQPNSVSHDTRQAAEDISAKFAGVGRAANGTDPRTDSESGAHVAVLVATDSSSAENQDSKSDQTKLKPTTAAPSSSVSTSAKQSAGSRVQRKPAQVVTERQSTASGPPMRFASRALPGADVGWRTGFIGMLTNPIFWH